MERRTLISRALQAIGAGAVLTGTASASEPRAITITDILVSPIDNDALAIYGVKLAVAEKGRAYYVPIVWSKKDMTENPRPHDLAILIERRIENGINSLMHAIKENQK